MLRKPVGGLPKFALLVVALTIGGSATASAQDFVRGVVYHDRNRNGVQDRFEFGVRGVAVSNGRDVSISDWRGRFRIRTEPDTFVFVVKPGGWATPVDRNGLPRFYIRRDANAVTLPEQMGVDFPLVRQPESGEFRAVVLGDPQVYTAEQLDWFGRDIVEELIGIDAAFGITLGDLVGDDLSLFKPLNRVIGRIGLPWYSAIGNHDLDVDAVSDAESNRTFQHIFGPTTFAFVYGRVHFILLDNVVYAGVGPDGETGAYRGGFSQRQLDFVSNYLQTVPRDRLVVLAMHIPFDNPPHSVERRDELFEILQDRPHTLSLVAHTHFLQHQFFGREDGFNGAQAHHQYIAGAAAGSWWLGAPDEAGIPHATMRCGAPNGYSVIRFDGHRYEIRYKAARQPANHQMNIHVPDSVTASDAQSTEISVNVFNGSEKSQVRMRLAEGEWIELARKERPDPAYLEIAERDQLRVPRPDFFMPPAIPSPHLWVGKLRANPEFGTHVLEVEVEMRSGQLLRGQRSIRVDRDPDPSE